MRLREETKKNCRNKWLSALLWAIFASGLLVELLAPHLKIEHDAFVIPPSLGSQQKEINPAALVARERHMQLLAAVLTLGGAVSLAFYYRDTLINRRQQ